MSPASKSKSKDKSTPRAGKEQPKVSTKPSPVHANGGGTGSASAYNPVLGTFHALEITPPSSTPQSNGRFRTIDDPEDHCGNSPGTTAEYDSLSNNGSCSGESEDLKEKPASTTAPRIETIPGCDNDKRDKIRQKNERKHQRQRERRAQELHERCNAFLTSRKLETLSHQLVAMGFPTDRATMAIIVNEGRMEESVAWLLHEGGDDNTKQQVPVNLEDKSHIKVDVSDELARVAELEAKHKCTKQDVERAVVACEGDLSKAEDCLRSQKQAASAAAAPKLDEYTDSAGLNSKVAAAPNVLLRSSMKGASSASATNQQQRRDIKDINYSKAMVTGTLPQDYANRNLQQAFKKMQLKPNDWSRAQPAAIDKSWLAMSSAPSVSYPPLAPPAQVPGTPLKPEPQFTATMGHEVQTGFQAGTLREPAFIVMKRPKQQQNLPSPSIDTSVSPPASSGWYPAGSPGLEFLAAANGGGLGYNLARMRSTGSSSLQQFYHPQGNNLHHHHPMPLGPADLSAAATGWSNQSWNGSGTTSSSSLAIPSSLGLFTAWGSSSGSSSSQNDWNTGGMNAHRDYTSIDWSLDLTSLRPLKKDMESTMFMGGNAATARPLVNVGGVTGVYLPGLQEGGGMLTDPSVASSSHEWTNPFEGSDLFRVPRQYVTSPSL